MQNESMIRRAPRALAHVNGFRRHNRVPVAVELIVQDASGWEIPLGTVDLSPTGMFVESPALFEVGDEHTLHFTDPAGSALRVRARVVRVSLDVDERIEPPEPTKSGMGYEFVDVDDYAWDALCQFVQAM